MCIPPRQRLDDLRLNRQMLILLNFPDRFPVPMKLNSQQIKRLKQQAHHLKPVVTIGNAGLTDAVIRELDLSLEHHELMKVRISGAGRDERRRLIDAVCEACGAEAVQAIGNIALIYRKASKSG